VVYLAASILNRWLAMSEHRKDALYLAARYWGWLRPGSLFSTFLFLIVIALFALVLLFPDDAIRILHLNQLVSQIRLAR